MTADLLRFVLQGKYDVPLEVDFAPMGWNETEFELRRDPATHGVFELSNIQVRFQDAYKDYILKNYNQHGVDADVSIKAFCLLPNNNELEVFDGVLDFATLRKVGRVENWQPITPTADDYLYVECDIIKNSPGQKMRERAGVSFRLETQLSVEGIVLENYGMPYRLPMHSQAIFRGGRVRIPGETVSVGPALGNPDPAYIKFTTIQEDAGSEPGYFVKNEPGTPTFTFGDSYPYTIKNIALPSTFTLTAKGTLTINYNYDGTGGPVLQFLYIFEAPGPPSFNPIHTELLLPGEYSLEIPIDYTSNFVLNNAQHIWVGFLVTGQFDVDNLNITFEFNSVIEITTSSIQSETWARSWLIYEALQKCVDFATDRQGLFLSRLFGRTDSVPTAYPIDGRHSKTATANGLRIRDLPDAKGPQFSYKTLYDSLDACFCIGWGERRIGSQKFIEVESRDYFYQSQVIHRFSFIKDISVTAAEELYFQRARFGFQKFEISETNNSLDEFCTLHTRNNVIKSLSTEYNAVSDFMASGYAIERLRRIGFEGDPKKGDKYDEDNFFISLRRAIDFAFRTATNEEFESVGGCFSPSTRYNLRLSPARNFTRHLKWLNGSLWKLRADFAKWVFGTGQGNINLETLDIEDADFADTLAETQDISRDQSDPAIFNPEFIDFTAPLDVELWATLLQNSNKYYAMEVSNSDQNYLKGWIWSVKLVPRYASDWQMVFRLLSFGRGYDFADDTPPPPPQPNYGFAYIANTILSNDTQTRGVFGTQDGDDLSGILVPGAAVVVRWWNNAVFTQSMTVANISVPGAPQIFFTQPFTAIPGNTQLNGINMKIRIVSTGQILKFGPQADQLLIDP